MLPWRMDVEKEEEEEEEEVEVALICERNVCNRVAF